MTTRPRSVNLIALPDQIHQGLVELARSAAQAIGRVRGQTQAQCQPLGGRELAQQHAQPDKAVVQIERLDLDRETLLLDLGEIEDLIDEAQEAGGRGAAR